MTAEAFLDHLEGVWPCGPGKHLSLCPSHADKNPSLSIREAGTKILVKCWAGCETSQIMAALGLELKDLFTDTPVHPAPRPTPKPQKLDLVAVAHRFEMAALDRRLRGDAVLQAVANFNSAELSDLQRNRLMNAIAHAFEDRDRADFLESVADGFRWKAFEEGRKAHAA